MEFHEYPKALYRRGEMRIVDDAAGEAQAMGDGYDNWHADYARLNGAVDLPTAELDETPAAEKVEVAQPAAPAKRKYTRKAK